MNLEILRRASDFCKSGGKIKRWVHGKQGYALVSPLMAAFAQQEIQKERLRLIDLFEVGLSHIPNEGRKHELKKVIVQLRKDWLENL